MLAKTRTTRDWEGWKSDKFTLRGDLRVKSQNIEGSKCENSSFAGISVSDFCLSKRGCKAIKLQGRRETKSNKNSSWEFRGKEHKITARLRAPGHSATSKDDREIPFLDSSFFMSPENVKKEEARKQDERKTGMEEETSISGKCTREIRS